MKDKAVLVLFLIFVVSFGSAMLSACSNVDEISNMEPVKEEIGVDITDISVLYDNKTLSLKEFITLDNIPTIVTTVVTYSNGDVIEKQSYIVYNTNTDVLDILFEDDKYGKLVLPAYLAERKE